MEELQTLTHVTGGMPPPPFGMPGGPQGGPPPGFMPRKGSLPLCLLLPP